MPITQDDVRLYASERMTDFPDGGGRMSPTVIVDGLDNNVFPDVTDIDRLTGRTSLRKIFGAVTSEDNDTYLSAHALLDDGPDDAATSSVIFTTGGLTTERDEAVAVLEVGPFVTAPVGSITVSPVPTFEVLEGAVEFTGGGSTLSVFIETDAPGEIVVYYPRPEGSRISLLFEGVNQVFRVVSQSSNDITVAEALPGSGAGLQGTVRYLDSNPAAVRCYGCAISAAGALSGADSITASPVLVRVIPVDLDTPYPPSSNPSWSINGDNFEDSHGQVEAFRDGDPVLVHSTIGMTPATVSDGQTVTTPRTDLSRLRVIGNNGVEHARFTKGIPAPTGVGCTANLAAGTVTFSDVSGMSQPVTVEHRIEEMVVASQIVGEEITFNRALSRDYAAGTKVSSLLMLGDLQGRVEAGFAQQAWTGVWSDSRIGGEPSADFNDTVYPIVTTNEGAITQRWYFLFTSTTSFRVIGEFVGEIASGNTGAEYAPINPSTGAPYFTVPLLGWGTGWSAGNVYRFNTVGAQAPIWALRCVAPSVPGGDDSVTVEFRGYVNA